ncbi:adenylate/guanylate cyclase domain-containing protein [uncultured Tateyamaria sp.]|uniref:adenylate/guanylate cyclase domain-containing protein n=1 Tax=uncultured Tateyamaria sp. TaxID=455651 RepID=UPI0026250809|nr:adenylate/guanylate cyclase domain-containing protein [uncultured Tateyamaria sp.]
MQRSLAAVLVADVAGYSELMGDNAEATLSALKRLRTEIFRPAVASRSGRVVKSMGDGWIVLFSAAADAATCALQIQELLATDPTHHDPKMLLRLGVHLGDVIEDEEDVFGDGVNVAARLEEFARPGTIAISDAVFGSLDGTLRPSFDDAGERLLKNIAKPVRVWTGGSAPDASYAGAAKADRPHVVIQPVQTSDTRTEVIELADALTGDVLTYLGATHWLSVTSGASHDHAYSLTSRLRASGARLRLEVRLVGPMGAELWATKIDGDMEDAFDWQDSTGETLVSHVLAAVFDAERRVLDKLSLPEMSANQCELRGQLALDHLDPEAFAAALTYSSAAIEKDPASAPALALALVSYLSAAVMGFDSVTAPYARSIPKWCAAAAPLAPDHAHLHLALGVTAYAEARDPVTLRKIIDKALRQSSSDYVTLVLSGWAYVWIGDHRAAVDCLSKAWTFGRQSPWSLAIKGGLAFASLQTGDDAGAIAHAREGLETSADYATLHRVLAAAHAHQGEEEAAQAALAAALAADPQDSIRAIRARNLFADYDSGNRYLDGLRLAGMPE